MATTQNKLWASTQSEELEDFAEVKFYCPHAHADSDQ